MGTIHVKGQQGWFSSLLVLSSSFLHPTKLRALMFLLFRIFICTQRTCTLFSLSDPSAMGFLERFMQLMRLVQAAISQHVGYITDLDDNIITLISKANELKRKRDEYEDYVKAAQHDEYEDYVKAAECDEYEEYVKAAGSVGQKRLCLVDDRLNDLNEVESEVGSMKAKLNKVTINPPSQHKLGKIEKIGVVKKPADGGVLDEAAMAPCQLLMQKMKVPTQLEQQSTSLETLEKIKQALFDEDVGILCVYGIGGVGKTTLMKKIYNTFVGTQHFQVMIWVSVSKDLNLQIIQDKIGKVLTLQFHRNDDMKGKRDRLYAQLRNLRYLLIFDNLWQAFSLDQVGIPQPDKKNHCKIIITSRSLTVSNAMEADRKIKVTGLTAHEAWEVFCSKTGDVVLLSEIQPIAEELVKECAGLPLALVTLGAAMRLKESKEMWENALGKLRTAAAPEVPAMEQQVFSSLKLSYDYLGDCELKSCFLYCSWFPEDCVMNVDDLLRYWIAEGFIGNFDSLDEALNKGRNFLDRLRDACLLETESKYEVKMHDLLRDLATWIISQSQSFLSSTVASKFLVGSGEGLQHLPERKNWEGLKRISFINSSIRELQILPNCSGLVSLFLCNSQLLTIDDSFFQFMRCLRILDLSYTGIRSLPESLSHLVSLRSLIMRNCTALVRMPPLGKLKKLQILDVSRTGIEELPEGLSNLDTLKQLDLSHTMALNRIPCNFVSVLSGLEHLKLCGAKEMQVATWMEVASLQRLSRLYINVPDFSGFNAHEMGLLRSFSNLKRFRIHLGVKDLFFYNKRDDEILSDLWSPENELIIRDCSIFPGGIIEGLMHRVENLMLINCKSPARLSQLLRYSKSLRSMCMNDCQEVKCIIDWSEAEDNRALDCLVNLDLHYLPNLENIFDGGQSLCCKRFQRLQVVNITGCRKLRCVFSCNMVDDLHQLKELNVRECESVEEIIDGDMPPDNVFQILVRLELCLLPKLSSIYMPSPVLKSLEKIKVSYCPELKKLPPLQSIRQKLRGEIKGPREWWERIEWEDEHSKSFYSSIYVEEEREEDGDALGPDQSFHALEGGVDESVGARLV